MGSPLAPALADIYMKWLLDEVAGTTTASIFQDFSFRGWPFLSFWQTRWYREKFAVVLVYLPSCIGQETTKWPFRSSSQAATCLYYQFNHRRL